MSISPIVFRVVVRRIQQERVIVEGLGSHHGRFLLEGAEIDLLWPGDVCSVEECCSKPGFVKFLERVNPEQICICCFYKRSKKWVVLPEDRDLSHRVIDISGIKHHDISERTCAQVLIDSYDENDKRYRCTILSLFEDNGLLSQAIERTISFFQLPRSFPDSINADIERLKKFSDPVSKRRDLTEYHFVTIDGDDAKDFDDAVFAKKIDGGFHLIVAIAHVSSYVPWNSAIDEEAYVRGTSIYFPSAVIPMLPTVLSEDLCSLLPNKVRLVLCCDMIISSVTNNPITSYEIYPAKIKSRQRLSYNSVQGYWDGCEHDVMPELTGMIDTLFDVFTLLKKRSDQRGMINFDVPSACFEYDNDKVCNVYHHSRCSSEEMIEQCMLAANTCVANFLSSNNLPGSVYRNHSGIMDDRLPSVKRLLSLFGMSSFVTNLSTSKGMQEVLLEFSRRSLSYLQLYVLCSMQHAVYGSKNEGHFGLALKEYTHFTSPIRRYPDLLVHRAIDSYLSGNGEVKFDLSNYLDHCSARERVSENSSRYINSFLKCCFMISCLGENFSGMISSVSDLGLFVLLDKYPVEGLVHISKLGRDYFIFDSERFSLIGKSSGIRFRLGDRVNVELKDVDLSTRRIYFYLIDRGKSKPKNNSGKQRYSMSGSDRAR